MTKLMAWVLVQFGKDRFAETLLADLYDTVGVGAQCVFLDFILSSVCSYLGFVHRVFNPMRVFRLTPRSVKLDVTKEELVKLGWTGTRKATIDEYKEYYREFKINQHGGMIQAHRAGLFNTLRNLGVQLESGEGYNTR